MSNKRARRLLRRKLQRQEQRMRAIAEKQVADGRGKPIGCYDCDRVFPTVQALIEHERATGHGKPMQAPEVEFYVGKGDGQE